MKKMVNNFQISAFVAVEPIVRNFEKSSVARFALSVAKPETDAEGQKTYISALVDIEAWRTNDRIDEFDVIKKKEHITVEGYFRPEVWTDQEGKSRSKVVLVATKFYPTPEE